ncbi:14211_t:CDS:10 [Cetraspora pellucida]|uniref:14211_t:CDS:1 n=1 Tax=Cetraspora pellucida TaxID=1433469 RepID=A0A9N9B1S7_9GLOM|nr:14211_t:CDS:10 [Cetraspora pellucida]
MSNSSVTKRRGLPVQQATTPTATSSRVTSSRATSRATSSRTIPPRTIVTPSFSIDTIDPIVTIAPITATIAPITATTIILGVNDEIPMDLDELSDSEERKGKAVYDDNSTSDKKGKRKAENISVKNSRPKKKKKKSPNNVEKRLARVRTICSRKIKDRINRATSQRMYLIDRKDLSPIKKEFAILGSTGNVYTVTISHIPNCTCPDFQGALISKELRVIFSRSPDLTSLASYRVRSLYYAISRGKTGREFGPKRRPIEGDCPICYEALTPEQKDKILWCQNGCGNNIHKECFLQWKGSRVFTKVTCVYCRIEWHEYINERYTEDGFLNLGHFQYGLGVLGMIGRIRDTEE